LGRTYYSVLSVGNISFRVALDTASADLWLLSSACSSTHCKSVPRYPLTYHSPTFTPINDNSSLFNVSFADSTAASGFAARETIQLDTLSASEQSFGLMTSSNVSFVDDISGILGLGFSRLSSINTLAANSTPPFATLAKRGLLDYPLFGVALTRAEPWGSLALGAVDSTYLKNASLIDWNEVVPFEPFAHENNRSSYLQWAIPMSGISIGTQFLKPIPTYPNATANQSLALIDVGTEGIFGPYPDVERIYAGIDSSRLVDETGQWAIPCDTNLTMSFTFNEQNFTLLPSDYIIGPTSESPALCLSWPKATAPSSDGLDWQFGGAFLRTVYTIFSYGIADVEPPVIGLYPLQPSNATNPLVPLPQSALNALFSSLSLTVATNLPNSLVPTPTFTTPPYLFNTSVPTASPDMTDLATSTYEPLLLRGHLTASTLPQRAPVEETLTLTDSRGAVFTTTTVPTSSQVLGEPPGWTSSGMRTSAGSVPLLVSLIVSAVCTLGGASLLLLS
ncbi:acid protease, partial [Amylostereum chailletii]